jgi:rhodanese-related sulfurtransferase
MNFNKISKNVLKKLQRGNNDRGGISYLQLNEIIRNNNNVILLDVRSVQEYNEGHLNGAINIPLSELKTKAKIILNNYNNIIIVYCQMGARSIKAVSILNKMGYKNVYNLIGGLDSI